jgi:hypothetical protein
LIKNKKVVLRLPFLLNLCILHKFTIIYVADFSSNPEYSLALDGLNRLLEQVPLLPHFADVEWLAHHHLQQQPEPYD